MLLLCFSRYSLVIAEAPRTDYRLSRRLSRCMDGTTPDARPWESIPGIAFHQTGLVGLEVMLHRFDGAGLGASRLPQLPHHPVINQPLAQIHDLNVRVFGLPQLSTGQGRQGFLAIHFYFHAY